MSLKEEEGLEMRGFEISSIKLNGNTVVDASEESIFVPADRNSFEFSRG